MATNNGSRCPLGRQSAANIRTLEREMGEVREDVRGLDGRMDAMDSREAERKGQITAWAAVGAFVATVAAQIVIRIVMG